jgi:peroxiredoxin
LFDSTDPAYKELAGELKNAGADEIICYSVSDPYSHNGWSKSMKNNPEDISFLADPDASFAKAFGLDTVYAEASLGVRSIRFSMIVEDGVVKKFYFVEDATKDAATLLADLKVAREEAA